MNPGSGKRTWSSGPNSAVELPPKSFTVPGMYLPPSCLHGRVRVRAGPVQPVGLPVPVLVRGGALVDHHQRRVSTRKAARVVRVQGSVLGTGRGAVAIRVDRQAVLEVADLIGHGHVVGVQRPGVA